MDIVNKLCDVNDLNGLRQVIQSGILKVCDKVLRLFENERIYDTGDRSSMVNLTEYINKSMERQSETG